MRQITALLAVFAVSALGSAFAADVTTSGQNVPLSVNSNGTDTLAASGGLSVTLGNSDFASGAFKAAGSTNLTFSTQDQSNNGNRSIVVSVALSNGLTALPTGVSIKMTPGTPSAGTSAAVYTLTSATTLGTATALFTAIPQFVTNGTANVAYSVAATQGFHDFSGTITYTMGTGF